ncbi:MAG: hypothetical protein CMJ62_06745 [Planctomycetaceae bacterium]|nr:hypothetical protein [Planctomycetaceae bacterium]
MFIKMTTERRHADTLAASTGLCVGFNSVRGSEVASDFTTAHFVSIFLARKMQKDGSEFLASTFRRNITPQGGTRK